jgi:excisionase family DNA binding protein
VRYYTTTEAAAVLQVDPSRVRLLCKLGRIETIKVGNTYGIAEDEVQRLSATPRRPGRPRQDRAGGNCPALQSDNVSSLP